MTAELPHENLIFDKIQLLLYLLVGLIVVEYIINAYAFVWKDADRVAYMDFGALTDVLLIIVLALGFDRLGRSMHRLKSIEFIDQ